MIDLTSPSPTHHRRISILPPSPPSQHKEKLDKVRKVISSFNFKLQDSEESDFTPIKEKKKKNEKKIVPMKKAEKIVMAEILPVLSDLNENLSPNINGILSQNIGIIIPKVVKISKEKTIKPMKIPSPPAENIERKTKKSNQIQIIDVGQKKPKKIKLKSQLSDTESDGENFQSSPPKKIIKKRMKNSATEDKNSEPKKDKSEIGITLDTVFAETETGENLMTLLLEKNIPVSVCKMSSVSGLIRWYVRTYIRYKFYNFN